MHPNSYGRPYELPTRSAALALVFALATIAAPVKLRREQNRIDVTIGGQPFTTYYFEDAAAKRYLMPLRTAAGVIISRAFPVMNNVSEADTKTPRFEPHQRPVYFAHGNIDRLDFWGGGVQQILRRT